LTSDKMSIFLDELDELMKRHNVTGAGFFTSLPEDEEVDIQKIGRITNTEQLFRAQFGFSMLKSQMWKQLNDMGSGVKKPYARIPAKKSKAAESNWIN